MANSALAGPSEVTRGPLAARLAARSCCDRNAADVTSTLLSPAVSQFLDQAPLASDMPFVRVVLHADALANGSGGSGSADQLVVCSPRSWVGALSTAAGGTGSLSDQRHALRAHASHRHRACDRCGVRPGVLRPRIPRTVENRIGTETSVTGISREARMSHESTQTAERVACERSR